jgi:hypothetical protein
MYQVPQILRARYDFDVLGGAIGTLNLKREDGLDAQLPGPTVVFGVWYEVRTPVVPGATAAVGFQVSAGAVGITVLPLTPVGAGLTTAGAVQAPWVGTTVTNAAAMDPARVPGATPWDIQIVIDGGPLLGGVVDLYFLYVYSNTR